MLIFYLLDTGSCHLNSILYLVKKSFKNLKFLFLTKRVGDYSIILNNGSGFGEIIRVHLQPDPNLQPSIFPPKNVMK